MSDLIQATSTFGDIEEARIAGKKLLAERLAACVQLIGPIESSFWWEGKIDSTKEYLLIIKTTLQNFDRVKETIKAKSSYELPEIIATPIVAGDEDYLEWFKNNIE